MHATSMDKMQTFRRAYLTAYEDVPLDILDLGSAIKGDGKHPSYKSFFDRPPWRYVGADLEPGLNVGLVLADPYDWTEIEDGSFDVVVSGQTFEHIEYIWVTIVEIARVLRTNGLACLIAPGSGPVHRHPYDCWRIYPDGFAALAKYAGLTAVETHMQRSFAYPRSSEGGAWCDSVVILQKPPQDAAEATQRAIRTRAAKLTLKSRIDADDLAGLAAPAPSPAESRIGAVSSANAIQRREEDLLRRLPNVRTRIRIASHYVRDGLRILRKPIDEAKRL